VCMGSEAHRMVVSGGSPARDDGDEMVGAAPNSYYADRWPDAPEDVLELILMGQTVRLRVEGQTAPDGGRLD